MKVVVTARAKREIVRAALWWRDHRAAAPTWFLDELAAAQVQLSASPISGEIYGFRSGRLVRRCLLERSEYHVYFTVDQEHGVVTVHAVWSVQRGRSPRL